VLRPYRLDQIDIYWVPRDQYPEGYNVYRSTNPAAPITELTKLNASPVEVPFYQDKTVDADRFPFYYYTVTEILGTGDEVPLEVPVSLQSQFWHSARPSDIIDMPRIFGEWVRRKYIILDKTAEVVTLLVRKVSGERCSSYNDKYEQSVPCDLCFDTGWVGGFDVVRDVPMRILPTAQQYVKTPYGQAFKTQPQAWLAEWPLMRNGDVVVRQDNTRYAVMNLSMQLSQGVITEQGFELAFIEPSNAAYKLEIGHGPVPTAPDAAAWSD
jgi:hypothetical protein